MRVSVYGAGFRLRFAKLTDLGDPSEALSSKLGTGAPVQALDRQPEVDGDHRQSRGYSYDNAQWHAVRTRD